MSKNTPAKGVAVDLSRFCKSTFTLTFAVEVLGIDVWHDCNEGWLDLGTCSQGMKIQYQLYTGQNFDVDILIWPHAAKIWCAGQYGWERTWQFLERRFLTFSIRHAFPVRVADFRTFTATITPSIGMGSLGANAKNDKNVEVFLPTLQFGDQRYFAPILQGEESLSEFIISLIWEPVVQHIPASYIDGPFDIPQVVTDIRHKDAITYYVKEAILNTNKIPEESPEPEEVEPPTLRDRRESKMVKDKDKDKKKITEVKFETKLSGDAILAGVGRITRFESFGDRPPDLGEIIALISSTNLPAQDDLPVIFLNVDTLTNIPVDAFKKLKMTQIYTRWTIGDQVYNSEPQNIKVLKNEAKFNDHHAVPLHPSSVSGTTAKYLDTPFEIELRGTRTTPTQKESPKFFGYQKGDYNFGSTPQRRDVVEEADFLIAVTRIDARALAKGANTFLRGEYPLYPPTINVTHLDREGVCTNDINHIKAPVGPTLVVPPYVILQAQMSLEVSIGLVGCKPRKLTDGFSRLYCLITDTDCIMAILRIVTEINEELLQAHMKDDALTGFTLDAGNVVVLYVEGPSDGEILRVWEMTEDFYPEAKPVFSSSAKYSSRMYPELLQAAMPFYILKMYVPLGVLLACPPLYARPALPLPTRSAMLKLGRLIAGKLRVAPSGNALPTAVELKSFRLELCVAPKPVILPRQSETQINEPVQQTLVQKIYWQNK